MKTVIHDNESVDKKLHIETELGVVNIITGLKDISGERFETIEVHRDIYATIEKKVDIRVTVLPNGNLVIHLIEETQRRNS